jgi:predicted nucleotidyltransferase component of viral defense system
VIDRREILAVAGNLGLLPAVVEKDYVLSWILAGINQNAALAPHWVFKGGTCLKKCYFETYRFSEDLDFTITDQNHLNVDFLVATFKDIAGWVYDQTGIELPADKLQFKVWKNKREKPTCEGRISYRGPIAPAGDLPRIKLDLILDEVLVLPPVERRISHAYSDDPEGGMTARCYAYEEAFAEKLRALGDRARPRDLYDVIHLYRHDLIRPAPATIHDILKQKCEFKGLPVPLLEALNEARAELEGDWATMLAHQLPSLPPVDTFWDALAGVFTWLQGVEIPAEPEAVPIAAGDTVVRAPAGGISISGMASTMPLEIIRFAASNRLTVEIDYTNERGQRGTREVEAYSLRRTQAGDVLLHAVRTDSGESRTYRVDRISSARATGRAFSPRFAIELTPTGPTSIPETERAPRMSVPRMSAPRATPRRKTAVQWPQGPTYVYQCGFCGKKFDRKTQDSALRPHKTKDGWQCSGTYGMLVDTKW